jgi:hypothetical protein
MGLGWRLLLVDRLTGITKLITVFRFCVHPRHIYANIVKYRPTARQRFVKNNPAKAYAHNRMSTARQRISKQAFSK